MLPLPSLALNLAALLLLLVACFVFYVKKTHVHWRRRGVPFLGPTQDVVLSRRNKSLTIQERYRRLAPHPCGGVWLAAKPYLIVRDPQIVQTVLIKAFSHFTDRGLIMPEDIDPLSANLFNLSGDRWKNIRIKLIHSFSAVKLKSIFILLEECTKVLDKYLQEKLKDAPELEVRDMMMRFTIDVIGTCAFGFDCKTIFDAESEFRRVGLKFAPNWVRMALREAVAAVHPRIVSWLNWKNIHPELEHFFTRVTEDTVRARNQSPLKRKDFMQLLINVQEEERKLLQGQDPKDQEPLFTDQILAGQVFLFFVAGFESSSITLSYCLYELALNPDIMDKLHDEIHQVLDARDGKLDYDTFKEMPYLECVIYETLRKYPTLGWLDRICTKTFEDPNSSLIIDENTNVIIPVYALHHDPQYFPNPQKFDPERFNAENKSSIVPGTYLPFGAGPRICVGMRFALLEIKAALTLIIGKYTVHPTERTPIPVKFQHRAFFNISNQGLHLRFKERPKVA
nr:PREDICTED: probable cytochrome P450 6a13 [Bemisia tabaci]